MEEAHDHWCHRCAKYYTCTISFDANELEKFCERCVPEMDQERAWIDGASYETLLRRWRFAKPGRDKIFSGGNGEYYKKAMIEKKEQLSHEQQVRVSKDIGWDP